MSPTVAVHTNATKPVVKLPVKATKVRKIKKVPVKSQKTVGVPLKNATIATGPTTVPIAKVPPVIVSNHDLAAKSNSTKPKKYKVVKVIRRKKKLTHNNNNSTVPVNKANNSTITKTTTTAAVLPAGHLLPTHKTIPHVAPKHRPHPIIKKHPLASLKGKLPAPAATVTASAIASASATTSSPTTLPVAPSPAPSLEPKGSNVSPASVSTTSLPVDAAASTESRSVLDELSGSNKRSTTTTTTRPPSGPTLEPSIQPTVSGAGIQSPSILESQSKIPSPQISPNPEPAIGVATATVAALEPNVTTTTTTVKPTMPAQQPELVGQLAPNQTIRYDTPQTVTISHGLTFQPGGKIIHRADADGLVVTIPASGGPAFTTTRVIDDLADLPKPPPGISKEVIEWVAHERLNRKDSNLDLHKELEEVRKSSMLNRQATAARHMQLASLRGSSLMRESLGNDMSERLLDSEVSFQLN